MKKKIAKKKPSKKNKSKKLKPTKKKLAKKKLVRRKSVKKPARKSRKKSRIIAEVILTHTDSLTTPINDFEYRHPFFAIKKTITIIDSKKEEQEIREGFKKMVAQVDSQIVERRRILKTKKVMKGKPEVKQPEEIKV